MSTTIDSLSIEIQSNSTNASGGIENLSKSLSKLKKNGDIDVAVNNLNNLRKALHSFVNVPSNASKITSLANSLKTLKKIGDINLNASLAGLVKSVKDLGGIEVGNVAPQIEQIAGALTPLNNVKGGGFNSMMNGLKKLDDVVDGLDSDKIDRFVAKIKELDDKLGPVSTKLVAIGNAFKGVNGNVKATSGGLSVFGGKVNTTTLNLSSLITVIQGVKSALMPIVNLLSNTISEAIEWDGVAARFGRGFGNQAEEVYGWIQRLNEEMGINTQQFMQYSSVFSTMLQGFGVGVEDSGKMALGYTELIYDIWAGYNDVYKNFGDAAEAVKSAIAGEVEPIRRAGFTIVESTLEQTAANHGLEISLEKATEAQKSYLRYLTLVDQAHAQNLVGTYARELNTAEGLMRTFSQQLKSLAQTFGSLFLPILVKVMPWLQAFIELLTEAIRRVAAFFGITIQPVDWGSSIGGGASSLEGVGDAADSATGSLGDTADAVDKTTNALKELKNATIGIDELNVISPPTDSGASGGAGGSGAGGVGGGLGAFEDLDVGSLWDESIFDQIQFEVDKIKGKLEEALSVITAVISGFMLAIGTILVVSGANIPLGLGLMAVGAVGLVATIAENWNSMSDQMAKTLTIVTSVLGGFLLAIGAFLAFSGVNVGLGAALMVAGAVSLGTAVTINWKFLEGDLKNTLSILTGIVSGGLLALGALFAFTGVDVKLGIGLMLAGAVGLATAVGLNWKAMSEPLRKAIGTLESIVGSGLLAFGAILALTGANIPLGVGMIAAGAVSLVSAVALNWNSITGDLKNTIATITALVSGALIGVGAILAFTGVATPLGIGMIAAGAVGLGATAAVNWSWLTEKIKGVLKELGAAIGGALLAVGAVLAFSGVAIPLGISLMAAGAVSLVSAVALNWDSVVTSVKNVLQKIGIVAGGAMLALGLILCLSGVGIPVGIALIAAGAVSLVSGIALNWDSVVTSVTNVLQKIGIAGGAALLALGLILCLSGVGIPLGIALMGVGAAGLVSGVALNWDSLMGSLQETWGKITNWWEDVKKLDPVDIAVKLVKKGWNTVKEWIGSIPIVSQGIKLVKDGWKTVKEWVGNLPSISQLVQLAKDKWSSVKSWIGSIPVVSQGVKLVKDGWKTVKGWVGSIPTLSQSVKLVKEKWKSVKSWIGSIPAVSQGVGLVKKGWRSVKSWIGSIPTISAGVSLVKKGWSTVKSWLGSLDFKLNFKLPKIGVKWGSTTVAGFKISYPNGFYTYAKGGFPDLGELFIAREAGPEMVGRIGNKTTVANNDQIVEGISEGVYSAVLAAMRATEGNGSQSVNVYLDGKLVTRSVEKHQRERGANLMGNQVYAY